jgi:peptidoglycan/xylan/chitin deacetylase (PgdA/CDA1 family)
VIAAILLIAPTISCIFLSIKVNRLQNQMNDMLSLHGRLDYYQNASLGSDNYAYAAVQPSPAETDPLTKQEAAPSEIQAEVQEVGNSGAEKPDKSSAAEAQAPSADISSGAAADTGQDNPKNPPAEKEGEGKASDGKEPIEKTDKSDRSFAGKTVYLTFDDGPSIYTQDILDTLAKYDVKASFFVIGETDKYSLKMYKRIVNDGHTLGMHSYSHVYKQIYNSVEDFDKDFTKLWNLLYDTTGYKPLIYRFPGGSGNQVNKNGMDDFVRYLNKKSIVYYDWYVVSGDATDIDYTEEQLVDNVLDGVALKKTSIVLMHDSITEKSTRDSLPELLEALISGGARILPLDENVSPIQQIKFDSIK